MQPGRRRAGHFSECGVSDVRGTGELGGAEVVGLAAHAGDLVRRHATEDGLGAFRHGLDDDEVAEPLQQVLDEAAGIVPGLDDAVHGPEDSGGIGCGDCFHHVVEQRSVRITEQGDGEFVVQAVGTGAGHQLVQYGERIAHGTTAGPDDEREHAGSHGNVFLLAEKIEVLHQGLGRYQPEGIVVCAGADGPDDLVRLSGSEDEFDVLRRLFDDLQQRVEAGGGDHVGFVNDEDLVAVPDRGESGAFAEIPGVVHAAVAGGVDLDDIERAGATAGQFDAAVAFAARCVRGAFGAIEAAGEDSGGRGFSATTGAGEEVGVVDPVFAQGRHERLGDVFLPDNVRERIGAISAVKSSSNSHRGNLPIGTDI